jgi:hypothetical protein
MNSDAGNPVHDILESKEIGASKTFPVLNETVRSLVSPNIVVNNFQSAFTSVSITFATAAAFPAVQGLPPR